MGEGRENRRGLVVAAGVGIGVGTLDWGRQILGQWDETGGMGGTKETASVELVMISVLYGIYCKHSTCRYGTIYYGHED